MQRTVQGAETKPGHQNRVWELPGSMELYEQITGDWQVPVSSLLSEYTPCLP